VTCLVQYVDTLGRWRTAPLEVEEATLGLLPGERNMSILVKLNRHHLEYPIIRIVSVTPSATGVPV